MPERGSLAAGQRRAATVLRPTGVDLQPEKGNRVDLSNGEAPRGEGVATIQDLAKAADISARDREISQRKPMLGAWGRLRMNAMLHQQPHHHRYGSGGQGSSTRTAQGLIPPHFTYYKSFEREREMTTALMTVLSDVIYRPIVTCARIGTKRKKSKRPVRVWKGRQGFNTRLSV